MHRQTKEQGNHTAKWLRLACFRRAQGLTVAAGMRGAQDGELASLATHACGEELIIRMRQIDAFVPSVVGAG